VNIGPRVREVREDLGMSQAELARRAGVSRNTVVLIEASKRTPSVGLLEKLARQLRTQMAELVREPGERKEADLRTWRHLLNLIWGMAAESGEDLELLVPSLVTELVEERHSAEAVRWIDLLGLVTYRWLPRLRRALPPLEEGLPLEEVRQISREATHLARLYIERRGAVRSVRSAEQREALDSLEEALEQVLNLSGTQFEELFQQWQHEQQGLPNLTEMRKEQETQKATAAAFHHMRHREASA
jgi:transcriptional regulator with XRE-family HTH domain